MIDLPEAPSHLYKQDSIQVFLLFTTAIAINEVDDVRPVLDFYKGQGDENILETFKARQAQLRAEEEKHMSEREHMTHRGTGGAISTFSFGHLGRWWSGSSSNQTQVCDTFSTCVYCHVHVYYLQTGVKIDLYVTVE